MPFVFSQGFTSFSLFTTIPVKFKCASWQQMKLVFCRIDKFHRNYRTFRSHVKMRMVGSYECFQLFKFELCTMHLPVGSQNKENDRKYTTKRMVAPVKSYELTATQRMLPDSKVFNWRHHCVCFSTNVYGLSTCGGVEAASAHCTFIQYFKSLCFVLGMCIPYSLP